MLKNIVIGKVVGVHGIRGALKVKAMTDFPERFKNTDELDVSLPAGNPKREQLSGRYQVAGASVSGTTVLLLLDGVDDRTTAEFFRGAELSVRREEAVKLPKDTYFIGDLIGCKVYEIKENGEKALVGTCKDVFQTGSNDVYDVLTPERQHIYLPAIGDCVKQVDVEKQEIIVTMLPGLREVYTENSDGNEED